MARAESAENGAQASDSTAAAIEWQERTSLYLSCCSLSFADYNVNGSFYNRNRTSSANCPLDMCKDENITNKTNSKFRRLHF